MKLCRWLASLAVAAIASGCAPARAPVEPRGHEVSTTRLTAAEGELGAPRVGKEQRSLDDEAQRAAEPKRPHETDTPGRSGSFGEWK